MSVSTHLGLESHKTSSAGLRRDNLLRQNRFFNSHISCQGPGRVFCSLSSEQQQVPLSVTGREMEQPVLKTQQRVESYLAGDLPVGVGIQARVGFLDSSASNRLLTNKLFLGHLAIVVGVLPAAEKALCIRMHLPSAQHRYRNAPPDLEFS
jgi:hypothetical protein